MYLVDYTIARVLMEAKLLEAETWRRDHGRNPAETANRRIPAGLTTVFRPAGQSSQGGH